VSSSAWVCATSQQIFAGFVYGNGEKSSKRPGNLSAKWTLHPQIETSQLPSGRMIFAANHKKPDV
jgi:hypothetical protein